MKKQFLVLLRHGQSTWNAKNLFTGWKNPDLSPYGQEEARLAAQKLQKRDLSFDIAYTSRLTRARHTLSIILEEQERTHIPIVETEALNERNYGQLSGVNKKEAELKWGENQVQLWRRSYEKPPPGGESLKDTAARVLPFYIRHIMPELLSGRNVLVVAHGNSLRALIMVLEGFDPQQITQLEINTAVPIIYRINPDSTVDSKEIL
ncbi:MAG: 2,3-bisphosphoglycerate-dependent phosphoglycerate mutase [Alphaproteobacteria bacterium]|nr:2,3-bisphosphoglycerate-dependent phosphoglycerate mutase [Alphaproteobacteria bacterium]